MYTDNDFIRLDWAAKYILRDKADYEVFEGLMTVLIGEPVKIEELIGKMPECVNSHPGTG